MGQDLLVSGARRSWSQFNTYLHCGEQYRLERVYEAPQVPAWWFIGGSAFHTATEWLDRGELDDPDVAWAKAWNQHFNETLENTDVPQIKWRSGGRPTKDKPEGETGSWWLTAGATWVKDYLAWREGSGWQLWETSGVPAVELEVTALFGDVPVKGFIDRVFVLPSGELVVVDLKTGSRVPEPPQNGLYATLMERTIGVRPSYGSYYMARKGQPTPPENLDRFSGSYWDRVLPDFDKAVSSHIFLPNISPLCRSCGVRDYCHAVGGRLAFTTDIYPIGK